MSLQPELVEPEPQRTLTAGGVHGIGIDPSTLRVSAASVTLDGRTPPERRVATRSFQREQHPARRLALIYADCQEFARDELSDPWPGVVWQEQPGGKSPNLPLIYACGAVMAGIYTGLWQQAAGRALPLFETIPPSQWKKLGIGKGWHELDKRAGDIVRLARERLGYAGMLEDEADALFIAEALRRTVRLST